MCYWYFFSDACNKLTWTNNIVVDLKDDLSKIDLKLIDLRKLNPFEIHKKIKSKLMLY